MPEVTPAFRIFAAMRVHMVAIGGSVMHNLALDLTVSGHQVTGSDDEFYEPSRSRLEAAGLLPLSSGWFPEKIDSTLDCVIAGMHARGNNPEIQRAVELGIRVYSFPEFFGERCNDKLRIVVAGSHGKTTTTAMIMHALKAAGKDFDYLVGASLEGFERNVKLSNAPMCVIEGDEYPSSPLDHRPKIMHYDPDIVIITGIAWDHMNVFPTWESYVKVFEDFISGLRPGTRLFWFGEDEVLANLVQSIGRHLQAKRYWAASESSNVSAQESTIVDDKGGEGKAHDLQRRQNKESAIPDRSHLEGAKQESTILDKEGRAGMVHDLHRLQNKESAIPDGWHLEGAKQESTILDLSAGTRVSDDHGRSYTLRIFGLHNLQNLRAAGYVCAEIGIPESQFLNSLQDFSGASMRLQLLHHHEGMVVYRDFAHAPSKVKATVQAVRERFPDALLVACVELHTYSSLNAGFLPQYAGSLDKADHAIIFFSPKTLEIKKMPAISINNITDAFAHHSLEVATSKKMLEERLQFFARSKENTAMLLMSSGRFENIDLNGIFNQQSST